MVRIEECGEPLVDVKSVCPDIVVDYVDKSRQKYEKTAYLRRSVAGMLAEARKQLPEGVTFVLNDAWRPKKLQASYFKAYQQKFQQEHSDWTDEQILEITRRYVIDPNDEQRAGHLTGAAVDLQLWNMTAGRRLPHNNQRLIFTERARSDQLDLAKHILRIRQLLAKSMLEAGFKNYPKEYWHWSYGDVMWAELTSQPVAIYGAIEL